MSMSDEVKSRVDELDEQRALTKEYLRTMVSCHEWHKVMELAAELMQLDRTISELQMLRRVSVLPPVFANLNRATRTDTEKAAPPSEEPLRVAVPVLRPLGASSFGELRASHSSVDTDTLAVSGVQQSDSPNRKPD
jgi:hypothetical protein